MNVNKYSALSYVVAMLTFFAFYLFGAFFWTAVGLALFVLTVIRFFDKIGQTIDIRDLIVLIPVIQWIIGPWLSYRYSTDTIFYFMSVSEEQYMSFVVPGMLLFSLGIFVKVNSTNPNMDTALLQVQDTIKRNKNIDIFFIVVGIVANIITPLMPGSLMFFVFLIGNLQYVGLFLLLQNKQRTGKNIMLGIVIVIMSLLALSRGMFQLLLLWFTFVFIVTSYINKTSNIKKIIVGLSIFVTAFFIQSVKNEFRQITWGQEENNVNVSNTEVFTELISERLARTELLTSEENINNIIARINQGWIITRIMAYTPVYEPFAGGETIVDAVTATLLPRFLYENKAKAGGKKNFERFTGRMLVGGTSMNLSVIGEAYANFGKNGAIVFMFFFGLFINVFHSFLLSKLKTRPVLLFFIPLIFLQVVKAESDFAIVLNHLVKSTIFVFLVFWGLKQFFNIRL